MMKGGEARKIKSRSSGHKAVLHCKRRGEERPVWEELRLRFQNSFDKNSTEPKGMSRVRAGAQKRPMS